MNTDLSVWVSYGKDFRVKVSRDCDVNDLIEAIKTKLNIVLKDYDVIQIELWKKKEQRKEGGEYKNGEEEEAYRPDALVSAILGTGVGASASNPFIVRTTAGTLNIPSFASPRLISLTIFMSPF